MIYLAFIGGFVLGTILANVLRNEHTSFGVFQIDPREDTCHVCLNTEDVIKSKKKKIVLRIEHDADLSQK